MDNESIPNEPPPSEKSKNKRKGLSKVRTGCRTCKIRRVKCDEARPTCLRCFKWGGASRCEGYIDTPTKSTVAVTDLATKPRPLLPNQLCRTPITHRFSNNEEYSYFQRFCIESTVQLTGSRHSELWNRVVLQASEMEPCVRHAVIAIGALDLSKISHDGSDYTSIHREFTFVEFGALTAIGMMNSGSWQKKTSGESRRGRRIAYEEYGKAIASLRKAVVEKRSEISTRLIACLLFVLFEIYHGNIESAASQTHAGIRMMEEHSRQRRKWNATLKTIKPPPINPETVEMFALLEIQAAGWSEKVEPNMYLRRVHDAKPVEEIPCEFRSLKHAAFILSTISLRGAQVRSGRVQPPKFAPSSTDDGFATGASVYHVGPDYAEFCNVLNKFRLWNVAFTPLLKKAETVSGRHLKKDAIILKMHYLSSYLWTASGAPLPEMFYERHTKELAEVVSLAKDLSTDTSIKIQDSLDLRLVFPLMIASLYYRHRKIRQEVISIFNELPRREGKWDASMLGKVLEWIVELEEGELTDEEYVPLDRIANVTNLEISAFNRTAFAEAIQSVRGEEGVVVIRSKMLSW